MADFLILYYVKLENHRWEKKKNADIEFKADDIMNSLKMWRY